MLAKDASSGKWAAKDGVASLSKNEASDYDSDTPAVSAMKSVFRSYYPEEYKGYQTAWEVRNNPISSGKD